MEEEGEEGRVKREERKEEENWRKEIRDREGGSGDGMGMGKSGRDSKEEGKLRETARGQEKGRSKESRRKEISVNDTISIISPLATDRRWCTGGM